MVHRRGIKIYKMPVSKDEKVGAKCMKINLWDGMFEFDFDWKAVVDVGIIILGCALLTM